MLDDILREMTPIQQPAHLIEAGCRLYTDLVESVPALKSCQSTLLSKVGGIAENEEQLAGGSASYAKRR